jgi:hypothetical protein
MLRAQVKALAAEEIRARCRNRSFERVPTDLWRKLGELGRGE